MATKKKPTRLTLHRLLVALSFWGSSVRILLVALMMGAVLALRIVYLDTSVVFEAQAFIYILGSFVLLDIGYVLLARALPLQKRFDVVCLILLDIILAFAYILPNFAYLPALGFIATWTILTVILTLSIRGLLGLLFSTSRRV